MFAKEDSEVTKEITEEDDDTEGKKQNGKRKKQLLNFLVILINTFLGV